MKILFIGDIFGSCGRRIVAEKLALLKSEQRIDLCIANGENIAGGIGITTNLFKKLRKFGIDVVTGGNHSFAYLQKEPDLYELPNLLRPHNFPFGNPGTGKTIVSLPNGMSAYIINLQGRTFFQEKLDCPFRTLSTILEGLSDGTKIIIVDMHAEASSEKIALASYFDGKISAVIGTHTHVQTADEKILPSGTAFITDVGMTGPEDSVIGMKKKSVIRRFLLQTYELLEPAAEKPMINAVVLDIDDTTGKARSITRIFERATFS